MAAVDNENCIVVRNDRIAQSYDLLCRWMLGADGLEQRKWVDNADHAV